jgi:hypothetical protein
MLNGRVYGARGNNENPFANARDEADPAFVEWGHGGMGSVRNGVGGEMWKRLQSENSSVMVGSVESETWGKNADDGDDGSGMGWVKRRREQREKQKMEEEEKHTVREGGLDKTKDQNLLKPAVVSREDSTATLTPPVEPGPVKSQPVPVPSSTPVSPASADKEAHFLRAVTIPAPHKHHTRTPSYSRTSSNSHVNISHSRTDSSPGVDHTLGAALSIALAGVQETPTSPVPINGQKGAQPAEIEVDDEESSSEEEREEGDEDEDEDNEVR